MPIIAVVIPTLGTRTTLLKRAIESCLIGSFAAQTEVIVVPNGPGANWRGMAASYADDSRVRFLPSEQADQNIARNTGLNAARGEFVRFLDDDDYLVPEAASSQYELMLSEQLDVCGGGAELRDKEGTLVASVAQPDIHNFDAAVLSRNRLQLTFAWIYRRSTLQGLQWPAGLRQSEDIVWLIRYATAAPRRWKRFDQAVGVWYQHDGARQSLDRPSGIVHEATAQVLLEARRALMHQHRWNDQLTRITAEALLELAHRAFPFRPWHWSGVAAQALAMDRAARPSMAVYGYPGLSRLDPRLLLWLLLPKRLSTLGWGSIRSLVKGRDYRRTL